LFERFDALTRACVLRKGNFVFVPGLPHKIISKKRAGAFLSPAADAGRADPDRPFAEFFGFLRLAARGARGRQGIAAEAGEAAKRKTRFTRGRAGWGASRGQSGMARCDAV
jgi:hypothetical protein